MKNIPDMKSLLYNRLSVLTVAVVLAACSATTPENDKQLRLEKLKGEQASLAKVLLKWYSV